MTPKEYNSFGLYAKDRGISSLTLHNFNKGIENSLTPYILEEKTNERNRNGRVLSFNDGTYHLGGGRGKMTICQPLYKLNLMFLDSIDHNDITMHI